jgi:iron complex outermembrane receptor protein
LSTLEAASPKFKVNLCGTYVQGAWSLRLRNTLYGSSSRFADPGDGRYYLDRTGTRVLTDVDASYQMTSQLSLSVGANNVFNVFPQRVNAAGLAASAAAGNPAVEIYPAFSPFGINGGYYYARLDYGF